MWLVFMVFLCISIRLYKCKNNVYISMPAARKADLLILPELEFITEHCRKEYICTTVLVFRQEHSLGRAAIWVQEQMQDLLLFGY